MSTEVNKLKTPLSVQFELTYDCNNYCKFCYNVWKDPKEKKEQKNEILSFPKIKKILDEIKIAGVFHVTFTGGEPTLHPDFLEIVKYAKSIGFSPSFITNANLITSELATQIKDAGVRTCQVSLHGSNATMHEGLTMVKGSFKKAIDGIKNLVKNNFMVNVNMTVNKENLYNIYETASLVKELGVSSFSFTRFIYSGAGNAQQKELGLERDDQNYIVKALTKIENELNLPTKILTPIPFCGIDEPQLIAGQMSKCDGGLTWCAISPSGKVRPCTNSIIEVGDLKEKTLEEIWNDEKYFEKFWQLEHIPDECLDCKAFLLCGGGCRACAYNYSNGNYKAPDPCSDLNRRDSINYKMKDIELKIHKKQSVGKETKDMVTKIGENLDKIIPCINGELRIRKEADEFLATTHGTYVKLNEHGLNIFEQINGENTLEDIIDFFTEKYNQPKEEIKSVMIDFLKEVSIMKLIKWSSLDENKKFK